MHVTERFGQDGVAVRDMMAAAFGLAGDLPSRVATGCGLRVPVAMTSPRPDRVTCLACREHARREHLRLAEQVERLARMPGSVVSPAQGRAAADRHRDAARRFGAPG
ncbi:hypothetical protein [Streptomonospora mangrovi]|uniref:hypothetical protein n=1 Tax=Streptomonospora mangrovi TaxID=2883123 RepID=UPI0022DD0C6D|nr:hypothetical protein [Streptomonospora mangrovi]